MLVSILPAGLMQTRPPPGKAGSGPLVHLWGVIPSDR